MIEHFDNVVIGSGFGGATFAYRLAESGREVCVLERGRAYPPGSYPRAPHELRRSFWDPSEGMHGLFDIWSFDGMDAVVASGLGGGSLIYANVLLRKPERWFMTPLPTGGFRPWPISRADLEPHYDAVEHMMNVQRYPTAHPPYSSTPKTLEFQSAARRLRLRVETPPLAVTFGANAGTPPAPGQVFDTGSGNLHGATRITCRLCGECDVGCNDGSKNSLDFTYLSAAKRRGAVIRERCEAKSIAPLPGGGYEVEYVERLLDAETGSHVRTVKRQVRAKRLILGAGTLGSNFLLLNNRKRLPGLSSRLGQGFSGNGDMLSFAARARGSRGQPRMLFPSRGPVITSTLHTDLDDPRGGFFLQDAGFPHFASWLLDSLDAGSNLRRLSRATRRLVHETITRSAPSAVGARLAALLPDDGGSAAAMPLLGMGLDTPTGQLGLAYLRGGPRLTLRVPRAASADYFKLLTKTSRRVAQLLGAQYRPNPLQQWFGQQVTVHPLGGCCMGSTRDDGVVNEDCEVFGHPGLFVVDGAVMPGPVGPNPSLTIAAIADRAATRLLS